MPFVLQIGAARVRMDGIGGVGTEPDCRKRGYAGLVMQAAVDVMRSGDAALSMLYGIRDYYPRFGYTPAGPEHFIVLNERANRYPLPEGGIVRPFAAADLTAIQDLYRQMTQNSVGTAVRSDEGSVWKKLAASGSGTAEEACRVVVNPAGRLAGYIWRSDSFWYVRHLLRYHTRPNTLVFAEVGAVDTPSAVAVLAGCRAWAEEVGESETPNMAAIATTPDSAIAAAARLQSAEFIRGYSRCGASMALVLNPSRLLQALLPELTLRWQQARLDFQGDLRLRVDEQEIALALTPEGVTLKTDAQGSGDPIALPQQTLARLALGAFPPQDLLEALPAPPSERLQQIVSALFPERHPHMHLPDRF